jgi:hypothetical protein
LDEFWKNFGRAGFVSGRKPGKALLGFAPELSGGCPIFAFHVRQKYIWLKEHFSNEFNGLSRVL